MMIFKLYLKRDGGCFISSTEAGKRISRSYNYLIFFCTPSTPTFVFFRPLNDEGREMNFAGSVVVVLDVSSFPAWLASPIPNSRSNQAKSLENHAIPRIVHPANKRPDRGISPESSIDRRRSGFPYRNLSPTTSFSVKPTENCNSVNQLNIM